MSIWPFAVFLSDKSALIGPLESQRATWDWLSLTTSTGFLTRFGGDSGLVSMLMIALTR